MDIDKVFEGIDFGVIDFVDWGNYFSGKKVN